LQKGRWTHCKAYDSEVKHIDREKPSGRVILVKRILLVDYVIDVSSVKMTSLENLKSSNEGILT
jgi:hypothetical protein